MEVHLSPDQRAFADQAIESGRLRGEDDVMREALELWERRERSRFQLLAAIEAAEASLAGGERRVITEQSMQELATEVKRRGRDRLHAERAA